MMKKFYKTTKYVGKKTRNGRSINADGLTMKASTVVIQQQSSIFQGNTTDVSESGYLEDSEIEELFNNVFNSD